MLNGTHGGRGRVCEKDVARVRVGQEIAKLFKVVFVIYALQNTTTDNGIVIAGYKYTGVHSD
jgi:hypothetical protein